ncbi:hypothetical protein ADIWIN_0497 [Winogradskyella psychrotolerans RS-3]|uniref:DUF6933 domain-containing protein n=1 Tax=Winogradskyella psychrotolerans RS-3 TaxID=641526 RepID=S7VWA3_9FLAO|nr:hypothetical protein [Winogradskyella psychrotolerans]EPR74396.1 hypothetical protein ADIWIN_0497 [Winogradskyella psychrotolerans RS-3]
MIRTKIYTTKKLEKLIKKLITTNKETDSGILGKWNATVFYIDRKKCWLITNGLTKYTVVLTDIKASELGKIEQIFKDALFAQLIYDGIITDVDNLNSIIGGIGFLPTDNDRSTTGFQNQRIEQMEWWKHEFGNLENMPIQDLVNRMNTIPIHIGKGRKTSDFTNSLIEMKKLLTE